MGYKLGTKHKSAERCCHRGAKYASLRALFAPFGDLGSGAHVAHAMTDSASPPACYTWLYRWPPALVSGGVVGRHVAESIQRR